MANERAPWMLTAAQLREALTDVPGDVAVALVQPARSSDGLSVIQSVHISYSGGPVLTLTPAVPPGKPDPLADSSDPPKRQPHHSDHFVEQFGYAIGRAGCFELKVRLLADKTPSLQANSLSADLTPLCSDIASEYSAALQDDDRKLLAALPGIRNKLLHVEFSRAQGRIKPFVETLHDAGVTKVDLQTGEMLPVAGSSTMQGRLFGWLLEAGSSGALRVASDLFFHGIVLAERLMLECDKRMAGRT
jgi:hypothetical protein